MNNEKKYRNIIEQEKLEISSRKLEISREHFMQRWAQKRTETAWTKRKQMMLREGGKNTQRTIQKNFLMTQKTMMVWSLT